MGKSHEKTYSRPDLIFALRQELAPDTQMSRLLWFHRAYPSTTLDKVVYLFVVFW